MKKLLRLILALGIVVVAGISLNGCAYSRLGRLVYVPSDKDPQWRLFMAITYLGGDREEEEIPTKRLLQVTLYQRVATPKGLIYQRRLAFYRKLMAAADIDFEYKLTGSTLVVDAREKATKMIYHPDRVGMDRYTTEPRQDPNRRKWRLIFKANDKGDFIPAEVTGDFL